MSRLALASFVLGVALMVPFEHWFTRVLGVAALFAAIVLGVFAIADPRWLEAEDADQTPRSAPISPADPETDRMI